MVSVDERLLRAALNDPLASREQRLAALASLAPHLPRPPASGGESNNHIHTIYSFSPYSPSMAALRAHEAGLEVAGSVDHDSIAASPEMVAACAILGIGVVTGCEIRVSFREGRDGREGPFARRKINSPDSDGIAYMTIQGVAANRVRDLDGFLAPLRLRRRARSIEMTRHASSILEEAGLGRIDFEVEVARLSQEREGGVITERHILTAVAQRLLASFGRGAALLSGLSAKFGVEPSGKVRRLLLDASNPFLVYDLLGVLKASFLDRIFIQPDESECIPAARAVSFARSIGAIPAYAYLGDVGESPTGDKKAEKFEDDYLDALFEEIRELGYLAVAYMPPRNTSEQLRRVSALCKRYGFMEISGVDINHPRQAFNCPELRQPEFRHLGESTWALAAHERLTSLDESAGLFHPKGPLADRPLAERISAYARAGRALEPAKPEASTEILSALRSGSLST